MDTFTKMPFITDRPKGCPKKTFTNVNIALDELFRGQDGIFFIKVFVDYIYE